MKAAVEIKTGQNLLLIARLVWYEIIRREEYFAILIMMGLYLLITVGIRLIGQVQPEAMTLLMNSGLYMSTTLAAVLTAINGIRLIPVELENGTLHPLLAKPISRPELLAGKLFATILSGWLVFTCFTLMTFVVTDRLPQQNLWMFVQAFILTLVALALLASGSVLISFLVPRSLGILLVGGWFFLGGPAFRLIESFFAGTPSEKTVAWFTGYLPDFSIMLLLQRFTDGADPLAALQFGLLLLHGIIPTLLSFYLAGFLFNRRNL
jgi:ABC-type transport system involved in multi-copper enzyme maturation permease subunit